MIEMTLMWFLSVFLIILFGDLNWLNKLNPKISISLPKWLKPGYTLKVACAHKTAHIWLRFLYPFVESDKKQEKQKRNKSTSHPHHTIYLVRGIQ
jgi:hypothetical protein